MKPQKKSSTPRRSIASKTLAAIFGEINAIKLDANTSFKSLQDQFFAIMRKYGIKQGNWSANGYGRAVATPEWSFATAAMHQRISSSLNMFFLLAHVPTDLQAYGKRPKPAHHKVVKSSDILATRNISLRAKDYVYVKDHPAHAGRISALKKEMNKIRSARKSAGTKRVR